MEKNWKLKANYPGDKSVHNEGIENFKKQILDHKPNSQLPELAIKLLFTRGINDYYKLLKFFRPTIDKLYDPLLMKDCDKASARIIKSIIGKEKIMVLGDYDVDGTCGVSMFSLFLNEFGLDSEIYIPDRINEGYGVSIQAIEHAQNLGIKLIVSIDCGITAYEKIEYAKELGIEFIICDHHQPPEKIPDALAVMDPLREDDSYPFKYLCGTGVAFKLIQAVCMELKMLKDDADIEKLKIYSMDLAALPFEFIDFVAIATASDIVSLTDENRILVKEGFNLINTKPRPALKALIESSGLKPGKLNTGNIVFTVAPRINAVGRLGDAKRAVELLTCKDENKVKEFAYILNDENQNRRDIDKSITDDAFRIYEETIDVKNQNSIVIHNDTWHPGVIGIVAARLVEKYNLPSIVMTTVNGVAKGSARSINSFNIYDALKQCSNHLIQFGGHFHAAGLELEIEKIEEFKKSFNKVACQEISDEELIPEIEADAEITFDELTPKFLYILSFFEPYGPDNMTPVFISKGLQVIGDVRFTVKANTHIFKLKDPVSGKIFEAVFFNSSEYKGRLLRGLYCDIIYSVEKNIWKDKEYQKLRIRDIKIYN